MLTMIILSLIYSTIACGKVYQANEVIEYTNKFESIYHRDTAYVQITIEFNMLKKPVVGLCTRTLTTASIMIDKVFWIMSTDYTRQALIFHELGHCVLNRVHIDDKYGDGCPMSIMTPIMMTDKCFLSHQKDLLLELDSR